MRPRSSVLFAATLALAPAAQAQEGADEIARRRLIAEAEQARSAGDHTRALDLAQRAGANRMTPSLRQLIAYEHDALGHTLEALDQAEGCAREAHADAALRNREQIAAACEALAARLRPAVGWITVRVPPPTPPGLVVHVGGAALRAAMYDVARPSLPGEVTVEATADSGRFRQQVRVRAGETASVVVAPLLAPEPAAAGRVGPAMVAPVAVAPVAVRPTAPRARVAPWLLVGGGALAFAASGAFALLRAGARTDRNAECFEDGCNPAAQEHQARFETFTILTDVALGAGALAVAGGLIWYLTGRPAARRAGVVGAVLPSPGGATLTLGWNR